MRSHKWLHHQEFTPKTTCNFGITEGIAALVGGAELFGGGALAGEAALGLGAAELGGATLLPEIQVIAGGLGAAEAGAAGLGAAELGAGAGVLGGAAGLLAEGGSVVNAGEALGTTGAIQPNSVPAFNISNSGITDPLGTTGGGPGGAGPSAFAPPEGVQSPLGPDPTANRANFLETSNPLGNTQRADFGMGEVAPNTPPVGSQATDALTKAPGSFGPDTILQPPGGADTTPVGTPGGQQVPGLQPGQNVNDLATNPAYNPASGVPNGAPGAGQPATPGVQATPNAAPSVSAPNVASTGADKGFLDKLVTGAETSLTKNPIGIGLGAAGLGYAIMSGQQMSAAQKKMQDQAAGLNAQGQQLMGYLTSGTLPPGLKTMLDQATAAAKAKVVSNYASQGMNADPTKNSALAQQLSLIDQQAIISTAQIGQQLATTGVQESGLASNLYTSLANLDATQTANVGKAIASMAAAFNTGGGVKLQLGS